MLCRKLHKCNFSKKIHFSEFWHGIFVRLAPNQETRTDLDDSFRLMSCTSPELRSASSYGHFDCSKKSRPQCHIFRDWTLLDIEMELYKELCIDASGGYWPNKPPGCSITMSSLRVEKKTFENNYEFTMSFDISFAKCNFYT